jgi:hypothetical protein
MGRKLRIAMALFAIATVASMGLVGCAGGTTRQGSAAQSVSPRPSAPASPNLTTPEDAVRSYLDWTSYAYRMANSDVATLTMGPREEVRVNSYTQMNKEQGRVMDQKLVLIKFGTPKTKDNQAIVPAHEEWEYRYLGLADEKPTSPMYKASYDTTYTVITVTKGRWVVDNVEAKALGEVK